MHSEFYKFSKRRNSTKIPVDSIWSPQVTLKNNTSFQTPSFLLGSESSAEEIISYNYCKIAGRYYYINEWVSVRNDLWQCNCILDELATYANEIKDTVALIAYDETANIEIADTRIPVQTTPILSANTAGFLSNFSTDGQLMLTVTGQDGSVDTFATYESVMRDILNSIANWAEESLEILDPSEITSDLLGLTAVANNLAKVGQKLITVGNAANNIRSARWIPFRISGSVSEIYLGEYDTGKTGYKVTSRVTTEQITVNIPWQYQDWRNASPYTEVYLYVPFIGIIAIPASQVKGSNSLRLQISLDNRGGDITLVISNGSTLQRIGSYGGSTAVSIPVGVSNVEPLGFLNSIGSSIAATTQQPSVMGKIREASGGAANAIVSFFNPNVTCVGGLGNASASGSPMEIVCFVITHPPIAEPSSYAPLVGTPSGIVKKIGDLNGYVQTSNVSITAIAPQSVIDSINSQLNGGVYIE